MMLGLLGTWDSREELNGDYEKVCCSTGSHFFQNGEESQHEVEQQRVPKEHVKDGWGHSMLGGNSHS